ncbi:Delta(12)-acyl-lipid-desaturase [Pseudolycoriella hygida]|uniref:Delta(12)-acyl-lipid-desaturase n=1 Tax=Pseudolycoriella hygida TaxID=35572 RepID=A0A9Q0N0G8_9DIPT|nr:Delta(12)-acyl-lipid-desaturase [Pseudolycoriella hygida]
MYLSHGRNDIERELWIKAGYEHVEGTPMPQPLSRPQFTLRELRNAVPAHCFHRSITKSFGYLTLDFLIIISLLCCTYTIIEKQALPLYCQYFAYSIYWFIQGSFLFAIWVLGHECGHGAFSESTQVNDVVGLLIHSALLTPYHSWQITHRKHHSNTSSCENDEAFVPFSEKEIKSLAFDIANDSPIFNMLKVIFFLLLGWMPTYLVFNGSGPRKYDNGSKSHFNPRADFFSPEDRPNIILSDIGFLLALTAIGYFISVFSFPVVLRLYILPYLVMNGFLVLITLLHHTDTYVPHFRKGEWTWLRGSLCTIDRSYGTFLDNVLHHITDTHVCHHIFSKMPFYHCVEATEAIKPILGKYYLRDETPIIPAMWRALTRCIYVPNDGAVVFYKKTLSK